MTKVIGPCFGLDARGKLGGVLVYSIRKGVNYTRQHIKPRDQKSATQLLVRSVFQDGISWWRHEGISETDKVYWNTYALGTSESGHNRFMRYYIKANYDKATGQKESPAVVPNPQ